jgi:hypothetical protein
VVGDADENGGEVKLWIETVEWTDGRYLGASRDRQKRLGEIGPAGETRCEVSVGFSPNAGGERAVEEGNGRVPNRGI